MTSAPAGPRGPRQRWADLRNPHYAAPVGAAVLLLALVAAATVRFRQTSITGCPSHLAADSWPTAAFVAVIGAFLLGGLLGKLHRGGAASPGLWTQLALTLFALAIMVAWGYETLAVANVAVGSSTLQPITSYIMCVRSNESDWTLLVFAVAALLAGRWLWHRPSSKQASP